MIASLPCFQPSDEIQLNSLTAVVCLALQEGSDQNRLSTIRANENTLTRQIQIMDTTDEFPKGLNSCLVLNFWKKSV